MLLTITLIVTTVYVTTEAPPTRGMSFLEVWIIGIQIPTIVAMFQSGLSSVIIMETTEKLAPEELDRKSRQLDKITVIILGIYFIIFQLTFWIAALQSDQYDEMK